MRPFTPRRITYLSCNRTEYHPRRGLETCNILELIRPQQQINATARARLHTNSKKGCDRQTAVSPRHRGHAPKRPSDHQSKGQRAHGNEDETVEEVTYACPSLTCRWCRSWRTESEHRRRTPVFCSRKKGLLDGRCSPPLLLARITALLGRHASSP